jgi:DNA primase
MPSPSARKQLAKLVQTFHEQVGGAQNYLSERGIGEAAVERFLLGFVAESDNPSIVNRLAIPYLTPAGPVNVKFRCLAEHSCKEAGHGKYIYIEGSGHNLYNAQTLLTAERVVLVEGELDAVAAEMAGVAAVAYPGTQTWDGNKHWRFCFDSVTDLVVVADGDDPGRKSAKRVAESLLNAIDGTVRVVYLPEGEDTNSFLVANGDLEYLEKLGWL